MEQTVTGRENVEAEMNRVEIDKNMFEVYCQLACSEQDICDLFGGVDHDTLDEWCRKTYGMAFEQIYRKKVSPVKLALRKNQLLLSKTSSMMAIFLGKNMLGQSDHPEPPVGENIIRESNEQMLALADLINRPLPVRTIEQLSAGEETKAETGTRQGMPGIPAGGQKQPAAGDRASLQKGGRG
ncbi:MAG: hypothetical protein J6B53_15985 [Clostridia bacterium]|nr:hypothetical protein [Clostridia bacterium]